MEVKIIDNFLAPQEFTDLQKNIIFNPNLKLEAIRNVDQNPLKKMQRDHWSWYLIHMVYFEDSPQSEIFGPLYQTFIHRFKTLNVFKSLIRMKINAYPYTEEVHEHNNHIDYSFKHNAAIFSLNTCDGYTKLKNGRKIESVANRLLLFDASKEHCSTTTSNTELRYNINFNFF